jgi:hypothetical protein
MKEETFVFGEVEVRKTGRTATKPVVGGKLMVLVEITPVNSYDGDWKKFVNPNALLTIVEDSKK